MARKKKADIKKNDMFAGVQFPCTVLAVGQPNRIEILEGDTYTAVDKVGNNLVVLDYRGREVYFNQDWFVMVD